MDPDRFEQIVGKKAVWLPAGEELDGVPFTLVVRPADAEQVAACLEEASARRAAVVATGGRSKLGWGNVPDAKGLVRLDLSALRRRLEVDPDEGVATVEAGVALADLSREVRAQGKRLLLETPHRGSTVGGAIAADSFGLELGPERRTRDELLGLEVALPNGKLARAGGRVVKNVSGFDLVRLYCGSLGTLGVITQASLRLRPLPEARRVLGIAARSWDDAIGEARALLAGDVLPQGVAVLPTERGVEALLLLEGAARDVAERAGRLPAEQRSEEDWARAARELTGEQAGDVRLQVGARPSDTLEACHEIRIAAGERALRLALPAAGLVLAEVPAASLAPLIERCAERGFAPFVERAPATLKRAVDVFGRPPDTLPLMRALKQRFDPNRVLAPGRFVGRL
jgi:glycolate oxidase FAD binding subunit